MSLLICCIVAKYAAVNEMWKKEGLILYLNLSGGFKKDISGIFLIKRSPLLPFICHAYKQCIIPHLHYIRFSFSRTLCESLEVSPQNSA